MNDRRSLVEGLKAAPPAVDPAKEAEFVYGETARKAMPKPTGDPKSQAPIFNRVPISTRIRQEFAEALKRASLERQLSKAQPNTLQDILEEAIEPWLRDRGYL